MDASAGARIVLKSTVSVFKIVSPVALIVVAECNNGGDKWLHSIDRPFGLRGGVFPFWPVRRTASKSYAILPAKAQEASCKVNKNTWRIYLTTAVQGADSPASWVTWVCNSCCSCIS